MKLTKAEIEIAKASVPNWRCNCTWPMCAEMGYRRASSMPKVWSRDSAKATLSLRPLRSHPGRREVMQFPEEFAWACACIDGLPHPFIHENSTRSTRREAQAYLAEAWRREDENLSQGWKRAYRNGWRCIRVRVSPAFQEPHHAE